jgi:hypothetical protein
MNQGGVQRRIRRHCRQGTHQRPDGHLAVLSEGHCGAIPMVTGQAVPRGQDPIRSDEHARTGQSDVHAHALEANQHDGVLLFGTETQVRFGGSPRGERLHYLR